MNNTEESFKYFKYSEVLKTGLVKELDKKFGYSGKVCKDSEGTEFVTPIKKIMYIEPLSYTAKESCNYLFCCDFETMLLKKGRIDDYNLKILNPEDIRDVVEAGQTEYFLKKLPRANVTKTEKKLFKKFDEQVDKNLEYIVPLPDSLIDKFNEEAMLLGEEEDSSSLEESSKEEESSLEEENDLTYEEISKIVEMDAQTESLVPVVASFSSGFGDRVNCINPSVFDQPYDHSLICKESHLLVEKTLIEVFDTVKKVCLQENVSFEKQKGRNNKIGPLFTVYFHNMAKFDGFFVLRALLRSKYLSETYNFKKKLKTNVFRNQIIKISFERITFFDSYKMVPQSLNSIAKDLLGKSKKEIDFFDMKNATFEVLAEVFKNPEHLQKYMDYCLYDSQLLLFDVMIKVQKEFHDHYQIDIADYVSSPSLGLSLYRKLYYSFPAVNSLFIDVKNDIMVFEKNNPHAVTKDNQSHAIFVNKPWLEPKIREAFFGGRSEVYKRYGKNLGYIDVNSLYPFAACSYLPFGSGVYKKVNSTFNLNGFFGFLKVEYCSPPDEKLLPILPRRINNRIVYSLGTGKGWFFCSEVKTALRYGYKIKVLETISFEKKKGLKPLIIDLYKLRLKYPKPHVLNLMAKLILNSLSYGKFAINPAMIESHVIGTDELLEKIGSLDKTKTINNIISSENTKLNLVFSKKDEQGDKREIYQFISQFFHLKDDNIFSSVYGNFPDRDNRSLIDSKISNAALHISAAVTSQSRATMYPFLEKAYRNGELYYHGVDSLIVGKNFLEKNFSSRINPIKKNGIF